MAELQRPKPLLLPDRLPRGRRRRMEPPSAVIQALFDKTRALPAFRLRSAGDQSVANLAVPMPDGNLAPDRDRRRPTSRSPPGLRLTALRWASTAGHWPRSRTRPYAQRCAYCEVDSCWT